VTAAIRDITERKRAEELIERNYHIQRAISAVLKISLEAIPLEEQMEQVLDLIVTIPDLALESKGAIYLVEDEPDVLVLKARARGLTGRCPAKRSPLADALRPRCRTVRDRLHRLCRRQPRSAFSDDSPHAITACPSSQEVKPLDLSMSSSGKVIKRSVGEEEFLTSIAHTLAGVIERYRADREKERLTERLAQAEKLSALGRVTASVADEIRNPLTSVGGFARSFTRSSLKAPRNRNIRSSSSLRWTGSKASSMMSWFSPGEEDRTGQRRTFRRSSAMR